MEKMDKLTISSQDADKILKMLDSAISRLESTLSSDPATEVFGSDAESYHRFKRELLGPTEEAQRKSNYNKDHKLLALMFSFGETEEIAFIVECYFGNVCSVDEVEEYILRKVEIFLCSDTPDLDSFEESLELAPFAVKVHYPPVREEGDNQYDWQWEVDEWHRKLHSFEDEGILKYRKPISISNPVL